MQITVALSGRNERSHYALFALSRTGTVADIVEEIKKGSSKWIKTKAREFRGFHWQAG
jgi:hypothetical protein